MDFENIMKDRGYWKEDRWVKNPRTQYRFETGSRIEFLSIDDYGKAHGPRRDILFLNEVNNMSYDIVDQLIVRTRQVIWMDWNPSSEFFFYTEMLGKREDIDFITLTFRDNEGLDKNSLAEIYAHKNNSQWWQVYGEGQLGNAEGQIYHGWQIIDDIPFEARLERKWVDFGYTIDPTAIGDLYYHNGGYILDETAYLKGLSNKQIADILMQGKPALVIADSAEPKSIDEIASYGVNILPAQKGKDSVRQGIQVVQDQQISVTKRSVNIIKEQKNYLWLKDRKTNKSLNEPQDLFNHHMDGIRYAMTSLVPLIKQKEQRQFILQRERRPSRNVAR